MPVSPEEMDELCAYIGTIKDESILRTLYETIANNSGGVQNMDYKMVKAFTDAFTKFKSQKTESRQRNKMKITKRQLRRIIREVIDTSLLKEMRGSMMEYINDHYLDFIDMYIRFESSPERFLDRWEDHCADAGIPCTQDHLVALKDHGIGEGDFEEDSPGLFIGDRGAY